MAVRVSARQVKNNAILTRITAAANSGLDTILSSLNSLTTPPFVMTPSSPADQIVTIGATTVVNATIGASSTVAPLSGVIPTFAGGTVTFPTASGGNAVPSVGSNLVITVSSGNFIKVGIAINSASSIVLTVGTEGASIAAAGTPTVPSSTIPVGFIVLQNIGGTIQTVTGSSIYQYVGSGGGGGGSGYTTSLITGSTSAVSGTQYLTNITTASQTITLPAGATNARVMVSDASGEWANFPVTVTTTGGELISVAGVTDTSLILNVKGTWVEFIWTGTYWATDDAYFPTVTVLTVSNYIDLTNQASTPAAPSSGVTRVYTKTDGNVYKQTSGGVESAIGGGMALSVQTASFSALSNTSYLVSTTGGAVTVTLPVASLPGTIIRFTDMAQTWGSPNSVTLNGGANNIYYAGSLDTSLILNLPGTWLEVLWDSTNSRWATRDAYWPLNNQLTGSLTIQGNLTTTGVNTLADGTVAAPSLAFSGASVNTGIYLAGADNIAISSNGVKTLDILATGAATIGPVLTSGTGAGHTVNGVISTATQLSSFGGWNTPANINMTNESSGTPYFYSPYYASTGSTKGRAGFSVAMAPGSNYMTIGSAAGNANALAIGHCSGSDAFIGVISTECMRITSAGVITVGPTAAIGGNTFAGNNIVGKTNGSAVAAGYIGERVVSASLTGVSQSTPTIGVYYDDATTLSLTAGVWQIYAGISHYLVPSSVPSGSTVAMGRAAIRQGSTVLVEGFGANGSVNGAVCWGFCGLQTVVTISATTIYKVSIGWLANSGSPTVSSLGSQNGPISSTFYAVRIA